MYEIEGLRQSILDFSGLILLGIGQCALIAGAVIALIKKCKSDFKE